MVQETNSNLLGMLAEDAEKTETAIPQNEKLQELSKMIDDMTILERQIMTAQEQLASLQEKHKELNGVKIPDLFDELGIKKISLKDGRIVEVTRKYAASITEENSDACFDWLEKNGHDSIIKHVLTINLKKGESEEYEKILETLYKVKVAFKDKNTVHPQTLAAFVREQIENGTDFPQDLFKVFPLRFTKVK